ncbi:protein transport protein YIF1 [Entomortierella parvispora]|uniref:Protein transport protein YIF1 n=1 Tax=Entomortierella parvispora TaxID=205924 RepID=A0A9P3HG90_9FUNG|nr:protein transport protein YIF1 [Entomortierella parvispora]
MNPYESSGYTQPQPRHNAQHHQQQQQQGQQQQGGNFYTPNKYTPNAYAPQPAAQQQQQHHQQHQQPYQQRNHMTSPPPLQHPVPTHPPVQMRDPVPTPSPRMPYAQANQGHQNSFGGQQQQQNQYRPQQLQQQQRSSFDHQQQHSQMPYGSPQTQYMSPQQTHGHIQPQQQQQQQQQHGIPSFPFNLNDGTTQLGMQFGKSAVMAGQEYVEQNLNRWVNRAALQPYFNVSNSYVVNKLKLLVFPWRHKLWTRVLKRSETTGESIGYLAPRDDINAPDMYIPVMAFVTYVLLIGVAAGTANGFSPEILGPTASSALAVILLEFTMIKLCIYLLNITTEVPILDLLAYSGYKFVGIILSIIVQLSKAPRSVFWSVFLYTGAATGFFLLRSLRYVILPEASAGTVLAPQRKRRIHFLICLSVLQFGFMWILV